MKIRFAVLSFLLGSMMLLSSCGDPSDPSSSLSGGLSGRVTLIDQYGNLVNDKSGAVASVEGTSFSGTTDGEGVWHIDNLLPGTYVLNI